MAWEEDLIGDVMVAIYRALFDVPGGVPVKELARYREAAIAALKAEREWELK